MYHTFHNFLLRIKVMEIFKRDLRVLLLLVVVVGLNGEGLKNDFNPLNPSVYNGYERHSGWTQYLTAGPLSAATADFVKGSSGALCVRVVVFMAHGAVLEHVTTECDAPEHFMGLVPQDKALRYFDAAVVYQEAAGHFLVVKRTREEGKCSRTVYVLEECNVKCPSPKVKNKEVSSDKNCADLDSFKFPPMSLISSSGDVGKFKEVSSEWMTYNPWDALGFVSREYTYKSPSPCCFTSKCYRLVVVTSYGRAVHDIKLSCGPIFGITSTANSLQLGNVMIVTMDSQDKFTVILNTRNSYCIRKKMSVAVEGGKVTRKSIDTNSRVTLQDTVCNGLFNGEVIHGVVKRENLNKLISTPIKNVFTNEILKPFEASGEILDFNLARDVGMMVQTFTNTQDKSNNNIVTLVARGVPVLPVIVNPGTPQRVVIRQEGAYYDKYAALTKLHATNGYQVIKRLNDGYCRRKLYEVSADGLLTMTRDEEMSKDVPTQVSGTRKETPTAKPEIDILNDLDCKNLIEGKHLKTNEALTFGDLTHETGVPKVFPTFKDD